MPSPLKYEAAARELCTIRHQDPDEPIWARNRGGFETKMYRWKSVAMMLEEQHLVLELLIKHGHISQIS